MSRPRSRPTQPAGRSRTAAGPGDSGDPRTPAAPAPAPRPSGAWAQDVLFRSEVDNVLAQLAQERAEARPADVPAPEAFSTSIPVTGMTCRACEVRIARNVGKIPGVEQVRASAVRGRVEIESTAPIPKAAVARAIRAAGYEIGRTPWLTADPGVWITAIVGIVLVAALAILASLTGILDMASGAGDLAQGGIVVALLLGLAAGVSTCAALVGGLVLALSAGFEARRTEAGLHDAPTLARMRPALVFVAGRIVGYGVLGAALGALGASVSLPPQVTAVLMIGVAIVMTVLGARLTGLSPRIATWSPTLPMGLGRRLGLTGGSVAGYSDARAAGLGAASFFLPCGFTQAIQIYALSTGSPLFAGAVLAVFAIGTAPGLLAMAGLPVVVPAGWRPSLVRVVGIVVLGFALMNGAAGLRLSGLRLPFGAASVAAAAPVQAAAPAADAAKPQELITYQDANGYSPSNVTIAAGVPTRWTIQSRNANSCAIFLVVPDLGLQMRLKKGPNTIDLPALSAGTINYSCSMGMYGGSITVVERPAGAAGS